MKQLFPLFSLSPGRIFGIRNRFPPDYPLPGEGKGERGKLKWIKSYHLFLEGTNLILENYHSRSSPPISFAA